VQRSVAATDEEIEFIERRILADQALRRSGGFVRCDGTVAGDGYVSVWNSGGDALGLHRNRHCGRFTMEGISQTERKYLRVNCKCWDCRHCGPRKAKQYRHSIARAAQAHGLYRFVTLTLDPKNPCVDKWGEELSPVRYIKACWARLRTAMRKRFKVAPKFISVMEFQKSTGMPHLHVIIDRYIEQAWLKRAWMEAGGGEHVDIRGVSMRAVSHYLTKYLTKELLCSAPKRSRRVTASRGITLNEKPEKKHTWALLYSSIYSVFAGFMGVVDEAKWDTDSVLLSFSVNWGKANDSTGILRAAATFGDVSQVSQSAKTAQLQQGLLFEFNRSTGSAEAVA
jgi:hypothetical protein